MPRANEAKIDKRYQSAIAALHHHADNARRAAGLAQASALRDKLRLCQAIESTVADRGNAEPQAFDWEARWNALPTLSRDYEQVLHARFRAALTAFSSGQREGYARVLEQNGPRLQQEVLRLEIAAGIDSGSEFARDRLKLQVETLQSSLKSGQKPASQSAQFVQLCAMPALVDDRTASRIEQLFVRVAKDGR